MEYQLSVFVDVSKDLMQEVQHQHDEQSEQIWTAIMLESAMDNKQNIVKEDISLVPGLQHGDTVRYSDNAVETGEIIAAHQAVPI